MWDSKFSFFYCRPLLKVVNHYMTHNELGLPYNKNKGFLNEGNIIDSLAGLSIVSFAVVVIGVNLLIVNGVHFGSTMLVITLLLVTAVLFLYFSHNSAVVNPTNDYQNIRPFFFRNHLIKKRVISIQLFILAAFIVVIGIYVTCLHPLKFTTFIGHLSYQNPLIYIATGIVTLLLLFVISTTYSYIHEKKLYNSLLDDNFLKITYA